jgi:hypothetical protein
MKDWNVKTGSVQGQVSVGGQKMSSEGEKGEYGQSTLYNCMKMTPVKKAGWGQGRMMEG